MTTLAGMMQQGTAHTAAHLRGGQVFDQPAALAALQAVTNGGLRITVDGVLRGYVGDFSSITSLGQAADIITAAMGGSCYCEWDVTPSAFTFTSETQGVGSTLTYTSAPASGTDISPILLTDTASGGALVQGTGAAFGPQWVAADGRFIRLTYQEFAPLPHVGLGPFSSGTKYDYWRRVGRWAGSAGFHPLPSGLRVPYDPAGSWYVSVADNSSEADLVAPPTVMRPPPGVR